MMRRCLRWIVPVSFALLFVATSFAGQALSTGEGCAETVPGLTERMTLLVVQLGVILFATRLGNKLFEKLRLPGVLGELCAGILIGPYALGAIPLPLHGMENGLFFVPEALNCGMAVTPELYGLCTVASIVLLFLVGVETDLQMFIRYSAVGSLVGIGGVVFSFLSGNLVGQYFLGLPWDSAGCIFLGIISTATSVSITARVLSERRKLDSQEGVTVLAGAVIDDVLGIILLAIGIGFIKAKNLGGTVEWSEIGLISIRAIGLWLGATVAGVALARWIARGIKQLGSHGEVAILSLGLALVIGGLFEQASLAMIIGAYVMGLAFSRTELNYLIQEKLHPIYTFLVPVFFAVMGMMVDVKMLLRPEILAFGLCYTVIAVLAKLVGCGLPTYLFGFNSVGALRVGMGMVPRGEVALIVAGIAQSSGMLGDSGGEVFSVAVMMTLITTLASPSFLVKLFKIEKSGMRVTAGVKLEEPRPTATYSFPNREVAQLLVNKVMQNLTKEGFFAHCINSEEGFYQARKDDISINVHMTDNSISFESGASASGFVRVVMSESLAEFEQILTELRKPFEMNTNAVSLDDKEQLAVARRRDILRRYLNEAFLVPHLEGKTPREVIAELLNVLKKAGYVQDEKEALELVMRREAAMATGVGHGVACPHARTDTVGGLVCAVGISKDGVNFHSDDDQPCRIILLTLTPSSAVSPYMTFITAALSALQSDEVRKKLLEAGTSHEIRTAFID